MMLCTLVFPQNDRQGVQRELSVLNNKAEGKVYGVLAWAQVIGKANRSRRSRHSNPEEAKAEYAGLK